MDDKTEKEMNLKANIHAHEHIAEMLATLETKMSNSNGGFTYSRASVQSFIGKELALAYAQGYRDAVENVGIKRLIF